MRYVFKIWVGSSFHCALRTYFKKAQKVRVGIQFHQL